MRCRCLGAYAKWDGGSPFAIEPPCQARQWLPHASQFLQTQKRETRPLFRRAHAIAWCPRSNQHRRSFQPIHRTPQIERVVRCEHRGCESTSENPIVWVRGGALPLQGLCIRMRPRERAMAMLSCHKSVKEMRLGREQDCPATAKHRPTSCRNSVHANVLGLLFWVVDHRLCLVSGSLFDSPRVGAQWFDGGLARGDGSIQL